VPGAAGHLGRGHSGVEAQGDGGVPQVVGTAAERRSAPGLGERLLAGLGPHGAVGGVLGDTAPGGLEDPPVGGGAVPLDPHPFAGRCRSASRSTTASGGRSAATEARSAQSSAAAIPGGGVMPRVAGLNAQANSARRSTLGSGAPSSSATVTRATVTRASAYASQVVGVGAGQYEARLRQRLTVAGVEILPMPDIPGLR
jgi:hypothetical protein